VSAVRPQSGLSGGRLGALFLTVFLDLLGFGLVMPLLPRYAESLSASPLQIGLLGASYSLMQFLFVPLWGRLSDRFGRRPVLLVSITATCGAMLMLGFAKSLAWLFVARIFGGIATANIATAQAYIADTTTPEGRARGMGLIGMAFGLGFVLGPFFGGVLSAISLETPARVAAGLALVNLVWAYRSLPESLPKERRLAVTGIRIGTDPRVALQMLRLPGVGVVVAVFFIVTVSFANLEQTFALYAHDAFGLDSKHTGYILGVVGLTAATVQGGLIGPLSRRFGEVRLVRSGAILQAIGFAVTAAAAGRGLVLLYVGVIVLSFGNGLSNPSLSSLVSKRTPADAQGMALGVNQSMGALARVLGPTWGGFVYGYGHRLPYVTAATGLLFAWVISLAIKNLAPDDRTAAASTTPAH
jgi:DHA1 family tetracycline resistance protein-like MFS transporter